MKRLFEVSRQRDERIGRFVADTALLTILVLGLAGTGSAREKNPGQFQISGKVMTVDPRQVTIVDATGQIVTIVCQEDFTLKVAPSSEVRAWYTPKDGINYLDWLEYPQEVFFVPAEQFRRRLRKVAILPNYGVPESGGLVDRIADYVQSNLPWRVSPPMLGDEIRRRFEQASSTLDALDASSGQFDTNRYLNSHPQLIQKVASETRSNGVLEVSVEEVKAKFYDQVAQWDGVSEPVAGKGTRLAGHFMPFSINGNVPAATVELKLWDAQGKLLWSNRRGFAVLYVRTGFGNNFRERPLTDVYQNEAGMSEWLAAALGGLTSSSTAQAVVPLK